MTAHAMADQPLIAETIARIAHRGQLDKGNRPYIEHPARVAEALDDKGYIEQVIAAGWLHDVIEDSDITPADLEACGIRDDIITAVIALTHQPSETAEAYYGRVKADWIARHVKAADLADNSNPDRLALIPDDATLVRLTRKYARARQLLGDPGDTK